MALHLAQYPPVALNVPDRYRTPPPERTEWPRLSIVTPTYNQAHYIEQTLRSVLDQGYPALEYIVQDGASTDETRAVVAPFVDRLSRFESCSDAGQADALNRGFAHATGSLMAWINSDDLYLPGTLAYVADYFLRHPEVDVVYGNRILIDEKGDEVGRWVLPPHSNRVLRWADFVPQETLFWRRELWDRVGGALDDTFQYAMDWDLLLRFQDAGGRFVRLPRFLGAFRVHARQKTTSWETVGQEEMARLRARCHGRPVTEREIWRRVRPYWWASGVLHALYRVRLLRY